MGPVNLAKIEAAHKKLMRIDPEYAARAENAGRRKAALSRSMTSEFAEAFKELCKRNAELDGTARTWFERHYDMPQSFNAAKTIAPTKTNKPSARPAVPKYDHDGLSLTIYEWSSRTGINPYTIRNRLSRGWSVADAVTFDANKRDRKITAISTERTGESSARKYRCHGEDLTISQMAKKYSLSASTVTWRLYKGASPEEAVVPIQERTRRTYAHAGKDQTLEAWSKESGIALRTFINRLRAGWSFAAAIAIRPGALLGANASKGGWQETFQATLGTAVPGSFDSAAK